MRVFKHGDALAIVIPQSMVDSSSLHDGEDLDFIQVEPGVFALMRKEKTAELARDKLQGVSKNPAENAPVKPSTTVGSTPAPTAASSGLNSFFKRELEQKGFVVVFGEQKAQEVSHDLADEVKKRNVFGVRGFDKNFYLATREFLEVNSAKILKALKDGPLAMPALVEKTKIPEDGAKTVLSLLMEEGEVIEKKKGVFAVA
ncbi:TPA: hypothetical protein HA244_07150 [Candidatus Micrarchaeota archaeon]|nr:hypothetical protein [Candidatus Micrarchaeota archaeon]